MKKNQLDLSVLCIKRDENLGKNVCGDDVYDNHWDLNTYLGVFAVLYDLNVSEMIKKDFYAVNYDMQIVPLLRDSDIMPYDTVLTKRSHILPTGEVLKTAPAGDKVGTIGLYQNCSLYKCDIVSVNESPSYSYINLASISKVDEDVFINDLRKRFDFHLIKTEKGNELAIMFDDKQEGHFYSISDRTLSYMISENMSSDQMKEYLLKNRDWLTLDNVQNEELYNFM